MEIYITNDHRTYIAVELTETLESAKKIANRHFKTKADHLACEHGWIKDDVLYFSPKRGAKKVWLVWRKTKAELDS